MFTVRLFPLHAFGARYDLPAPLYLFLIGAGAVVFVSFLLVLRRPVTRMRPTGDDVPPVPQVRSWPGWLLFVIAVFGLMLSPLLNALSRFYERQCDRYALERTANPRAYRSAFIKLAKINKSDPDPHPLVALLFYDHPPIRERLAMAD